MTAYKMKSGIPYTVRTSKRAKRVSLRVSARKGVELILPLWVSHEEVIDFVEERDEWVTRTWEKYSAQKAHVDAQPLLPKSVYLAFSDARYSVCFRQEVTTKPSLRVNGSTLYLSTPSEESAVSLLQGWLKAEARRALVPFVRLHSEQSGLDCSRVQIRLQRSRWGSCSMRGTISLNAKLLFLSEPLVRYVVLHELAHVRHADHSLKFWNFLRQLEPEADALDKELDMSWQILPKWVSYVNTGC